MSNAPKILIAAPQSNVKNYCFVDWVLNINRFSYPKENITILLVDNSDTKDNVDYIKSFGIECIYVDKKDRGIIETLAECHQICLDYAIEHKYDYLFHLETDVFPKHDVLINYESLIDGNLMEVFSGALGCTLISKKVFSKIKFRHVKGENQHPDTWFAQDLYLQKIPIYVDTNSFCKHFNASWGTFNLNFK